MFPNLSSLSYALEASRSTLRALLPPPPPPRTRFPRSTTRRPTRRARARSRQAPLHRARGGGPGRRKSIARPRRRPLAAGRNAPPRNARSWPSGRGARRAAPERVRAAYAGKRNARFSRGGKVPGSYLILSATACASTNVSSRARKPCVSSGRRRVVNRASAPRRGFVFLRRRRIHRSSPRPLFVREAPASATTRRPRRPPRRARPRRRRPRGDPRRARPRVSKSAGRRIRHLASRKGLTTTTPPARCAPSRCTRASRPARRYGAESGNAPWS